MQKTLWGRLRDSEREREREKARGWREVAAPSRLPVSKNPAGANWRSLGVGRGGRREGRESQHDKDEAKTGHRLSVCFLCRRVTGEQKLWCAVAAARNVNTSLLQPAGHGRRGLTVWFSRVSPCLPMTVAVQ